MRHMHPWTDERLAQLERLWIEGLTTRLIAAAMGPPFTRNAILGKAHRIGLPLRKPAMPMKTARPRVPQPDRSARFRGSLAARLQRPPIKTAPLPKSEAWKPLPGTTPIGLLQLTDATCRWPVGEHPHRFCGCAPAANERYCDIHKAVSARAIPAKEQPVSVHRFSSGKRVHSSRVDLRELSA